MVKILDARTRSSKAVLTAGTSLLQAGIGLITSLLITPFIVQLLSPEGYGTWLYVVQFIGFLTVVDVFPGSSLKLQLALHRTPDGALLKRQLVGAHICIACGALPLYALAGLVAIPLLPKFLSGYHGSLPDLSVSAWILLLTAALNKFLATPGMVLRGENLDYQANILRSVLALLMALLDFIMVYQGFGIPGLAFSKFIAAIALALCLHWVVSRHVKWFGWHIPEISQLRETIRLNAWIYISNASNTLSTGTDLLILGWFTSPFMVSVYALTATLSKFCFGLLTTVLQSVNPGLGDLFGSKNYARLSEVRMLIEQLTLFLCGIVAASCLVLNAPFIRLWVGDQLFGGALLNAAFVLLGVLAVIVRTQQNFLAAVLNLKMLALWSLLTSIVSVTAALLLAEPYGGAGIVFASCAGALLASYHYHGLISAHLGYQGHYETPWRLYLAILFCCIPALKFAGDAAISSWSEFVLYGILIVGAASLILWFGGIATPTRRMLTAYFR